MNQHQLTIAAQHRPEALERIIRVVRHRGFQIKTLQMGHHANTDSISIEITVMSSRNIELLSTQLSKLMDVDSVQISQNITQQIRA